MQKLTRRKFLYAGAVAAAGISALGVDGFLESNDPHLVRVEISLDRLPHSFDGFTIAQLSDLHFTEHFSSVPIRKSVGIINSLKPDLIALTGDFVTVPVFETVADLRRAVNTAAPCAEILRELRASVGRFAILGNHDCDAGGGQITGILKEHQIPVLRNNSAPLERGRDRIWLAGIDDVLKGYPDLGATIDNIPAGETTILLAHEPDFVDESSLRAIDLQLSGHSHGGQVWIPGVGAPWLPPLARKYPRGMYQVGRTVLYANIGIGTIRAPIRINCQPEVTLITLRAGRT